MENTALPAARPAPGGWTFHAIGSWKRVTPQNDLLVCLDTSEGLFKVHINEDNELVISLEKKTENKEEDAKRKGTYLRREFSYTQFQQSLLLPDNIERENISAKVENGVMTIDIPKKKIEETAAATRQIEVK